MATRGSRSGVRRCGAVTVTVVLTALLLITGCGDGADRSAPLSKNERSSVDGALTDLGAYCRKVRLYFTERGSAPTPRETGAAETAVDEVVAIARAKPGAEYRPGQTMRLLVGDTAEDLEASECSRPLVARLSQAQASIPNAP
jgi:hypothetical protein